MDIDSNRRRFLAVAAGASVGTMAVAAMPTTVPDSPACADDPAFALIAANAARRLRNRRKTARGRLSADDAYHVTNIRRRPQWLVNEYQIPSSALPKITPVPTEELCDFIEKYRVNCDWLIAGDFKGLHGMTNERKARRVITSTAVMNDDPPPFRVEMTGKEFEAALRTLPESAQREIEAKLRQIVEDQKR